MIGLSKANVRFFMSSTLGQTCWVCNCMDYRCTRYIYIPRGSITFLGSRVYGNVLNLIVNHSSDSGIV